jgi:hypothetical protein
MKSVEPRRGPYEQEVTGSSPVLPTNTFQSDTADLKPFTKCRPPALGRLKESRANNGDMDGCLEPVDRVSAPDTNRASESNFRLDHHSSPHLLFAYYTSQWLTSVFRQHPFLRNSKNLAPTLGSVNATARKRRSDRRKCSSAGGSLSYEPDRLPSDWRRVALIPGARVE